MKQLSGLLFPLLIAGTLAALSFILQWYVSAPLTAPYAPPQHKPSNIVTQAVVHRIDAQGNLKFKMTARQIVQYQDDESSWLDSPVLENHRTQGATTTLTADQGLANGDISRIDFTGNVNIQRPAYKDQQPLQAHMPTLTVFPDDAKAHSDSAVHLQRGRSWLKGIGMDLDNDQLQFSLAQRVTGRYFSSTQTAPAKP